MSDPQAPTAGAYAPYPPAPPPQVKTNSLAIASFVLGIVWIYWIGSILALVFGYLALRQIRQANGWQEGRGLALAGVVLGWIGVAVLALVLVVTAMVANGDDDAGDQFESTTTLSIDTRTGPSDTTSPLAEASNTNPELSEEVLARRPPVVQPPPADTPADALETITLIEGEGRGAQAGDTVIVHYAGVLSDGTQFDDSWSRGQPFPVTLGQGMVIPGWDEGLVGAKIGERRHLVIGSDKGYGSIGQGEIPPDAPMAFDVDVVDILPATAG